MSRNDELRELGERLLSLAASDQADYKENSVRLVAPPEHDDEFDETILIQMAHTLYRLRRDRIRELPPDLFGEPAWDMLLDLFIQRSMGRRVPVTSLCIASGVPTTTALRWIGILTELELIERSESKEDRRKAYISLTKKGYNKVRSILIDASRSLPQRPTPFMLSRLPSR